MNEMKVRRNAGLVILFVIAALIVLLVYSEDMLVQDVNGQEIDLAELSAENRIRVELAPREKIPSSEGYLDPVIETITLLPTGSDEYI